MSGWGTATVMATDEDAAEELADLLENANEDQGNWADTRDGTRVNALVWGYGGNSAAMSVLKRNADKWDEAIIMKCNDTSDSGSGAYYTSDGTRRGIEKEASASGYEGARGHDAAGELRGKAGFRPYMR